MADKLPDGWDLHPGVPQGYDPESQIYRVVIYRIGFLRSFVGGYGSTYEEAFRDAVKRALANPSCVS